MAGWKEIEGKAQAGRDYGNGRRALVSTERTDWCGKLVYRWEIRAELWGGRLDGTNYSMGETAIREGHAATVAEAKALCDKFAS